MSPRKKILIIVVVGLVILIGAIVANMFMGKSYLKELKYDEVIEKIENKENFVLLVSQTTCLHCISYKPKLEDVANKYKLEVYYIDVDLLDEEKREEFKTYISFSSTPVTLFLKDGEETTVANRISGDTSKEKIEKKLKSNGFVD